MIPTIMLCKEWPEPTHDFYFVYTDEPHLVARVEKREDGGLNLRCWPPESYSKLKPEELEFLLKETSMAISLALDRKVAGKEAPLVSLFSKNNFFPDHLLCAGADNNDIWNIFVLEPAAERLWMLDDNGNEDLDFMLVPKMSGSGHLNFPVVEARVTKYAKRFIARCRALPPKKRWPSFFRQM